MHEYRERNQKEPPETPGVDAANLVTGEMERYMDIAGQYGLQNMMIGEPVGNQQTIEQEYRAYIAQTLSPKTISVLKYWEVGDSSMVF